MIEGTTMSGFAFVIEDEARDDMEILDNLTKLANGDLTVMPIILSSLLGEEQKKKLYEHCRGSSGRVSSKAVTKELTDIFAVTKNGESELKNS